MAFRRRIRGGGGGGSPIFSSEYQAILDYASSQGYVLPSILNQFSQNALLVKMKNQGIWQQLDVFYNFVTDGDQAFASINWKAPASFLITRVNAPTFASMGGFTTNGTNSYLNTNWTPSAGINYQQNDASIFTHSNTDTEFATGIDFGTGGAANLHRTAFVARTAGGIAGGALNETLPVGRTTPNTIGSGFFQFQRTGATAYRVLRNGLQVGPLTGSSTGRSTFPMYIGTENFNNVATGFIARNYWMFAAGSQVATKEVEFFAIWAEYIVTPALATATYQGVLDYATAQGFTLPSAGVQTDQRSLILNLMLFDIWGKLDVFYNFIGDGDHNFAKINWKSPGTFQADGVGHEPAYAPFTGFTGNGTSAYLNTQLAPSAGTNMTTANACAFIGLRDTGKANTTPFGCVDVGGHAFRIQSWNVAGNFSGVINSTVGFNIASNRGDGLVMAQRLGGNCEAWYNGVRLGTAVDGASQRPSQPMYLLALNNIGIPTSWSTNTAQMFGAGFSLAGKESTLNSIWYNYAAPYLAQAEYKRVTDYATVQVFSQPSAAIHTANQKLIEDMIRNDVWGLLDVFYQFVTDGDHNFAKINWKSPGQFQAIGTGHEPTFTPLTGFTGNATTSMYLDTQWTPSLHAKSISLASGWMSVANAGGIALNVINGCVDPASHLIFALMTAVNTVDGRFFHASAVNPITNASLTQTPGLFQFWRNDASFSGAKKDNNADVIGTTNLPAAALTTRSFYVFAFNNAVPSQPTRETTQHLAIGARISAASRSAWYTAWTTFLESTYSLRAQATYDAVKAYATSQGFVLPSSAIQTAHVALIDSLIRSGVWDQLEVYYNFIGDGDHNFAKINWKRPGTFQAIGTGHEPTFLPNQGFKGNGVSAYLNTQFAQNSGAQQVRNNSVFMDITQRTFEAAPSKEEWGAYDGTIVSFHNSNYTPAVDSITFNGATLQGIAGSGFHHINSNPVVPINLIQYLSGIQVAATGSGAGALITTPYYVLGRNQNGVLLRPSDGLIGCWGTGVSLGSTPTDGATKALSLFNAWAEFKAKVAYKRIIDYANTQGFILPSQIVQDASIAMITDLIKNSIWDYRLDVFYNFFTDSPSSGFAKINWKNPGTFQADGTGHEPLFTPLGGFTGNGTSSYLNTTFNPSVHGANYVASSASFILATDTHLDSSGFDLGGSDAGFSTYLRSNLAGGAAFTVNGNVNEFFGNVPSAGFYNGNRLGNNVYQWKNGVSVYTNGTATFGQVAAPIFVCSNNTSGTPNNFSTRRIQCFGLGGSMTSRELSVYTIWNTYRQQLMPLAATVAYQRVIDYAISQAFVLPSVAVQAAQKKLIEDMMRNDIWEALDVFYNFDTDGDSGFAKINWKNPGTFQLAQTGTVDLIAGDGFVNQTGGYFNTGFTPLNGVRTLNFSAFFDEGGAPFVGTNSCLGAGTSNGVNCFQIVTKMTDSKTYFDAFGANSGAINNALAGSSGFWNIDKAGANHKLHWNGAQQFTAAVGAAQSSLFPIYLFGSNYSGVLTFPKVTKFRCFGFSSSLDTKQTVLYTIWQAYKQAVSSALVGYSLQYQNVLDRAIDLSVTVPIAASRSKQDTLMRSLLTSGIFSHLDRLRVFKYSNNLAFAGIDWIDPTVAVSTNVASPTFDDLKGVKSDGVASYVNPLIVPSALTKYSLNNASFFVYTGDTINMTVGGRMLMAVFGGGLENQLGFSAPRTFYSLNENNIVPPSVSILQLGLNMVQRLAPTSRSLIANGIKTSFQSNAAGLPVITFYICARNNAGVADLFNTDYIAIAGVGDGLANLEAQLKTVTDAFYAS